MNRLKEMRMKRGVKQCAIADYIGVSHITYSAYEKDPSKISLGNAQKICDFLHCKLSDIFLDTNYN